MRLVSFLMLAMVFTASAEDWPEWRGKGRRGVWNETGILQKFADTGLRVAWRVPIKSGFSGPAVSGGRIYVTDFTESSHLKGRERVLCLDEKTGKILWTKPKTATYPAALLRTADDKLLMLDDFGNLTLIEPNAEKYVELAKSKVCGATWAHPALTNGRVYLRDEKELMCLELGK